MRRLINLAVILPLTLLLAACGPEVDAPDSVQPVPDASLVDDNNEEEPPTETKLVFDWNAIEPNILCEGLASSENRVTVGATYDPYRLEQNRQALDLLQAQITEQIDQEVEILSRNAKLGVLKARVPDCESVHAIKTLESVEFVELQYFSLITDQGEVVSAASAFTAPPLETAAAEEDDEAPINPAFYDPDTHSQPYHQYIEEIDKSGSRVIQRHGLDRIYEEFEFFGRPNVGVAVLDNGVLESDIEFLSQGDGQFSAEGYLKPFGSLTPEPDGIEPQRYDLLGITSVIGNIYDHGSRQLKHVYSIAPHVNIKSVRASFFVVLLFPAQFQGAIDAIVAMADDPEVRVISFSMGTFIHLHELARAIDYFNAQDKIFVAAAGTTAPYVKDLAKIVFPASLPSTISTTGIQDTLETGGEFILGNESHGGLGNDFVVDFSPSSSETVSTTAGMIALLWSLAPELNREDIIQIMIESSNIYQETGERDPVFGWGKVDMYQGFQAVLERAE